MLLLAHSWVGNFKNSSTSKPLEILANNILLNYTTELTRKQGRAPGVKNVGGGELEASVVNEIRPFQLPWKEGLLILLGPPKTGN